MKRRRCSHPTPVEPERRAGRANVWRCSLCGRRFIWSPLASWYGSLECPGCERSVVLEVRCGACPAGGRHEADVLPLSAPPSNEEPMRVAVTSPVAVEIGRVAALLAGRGYRYRDERDLQAELARVLEAGWPDPVLREVPLAGAGIIDFLVGTIGLEVKVDGGVSAVTRQLSRYLQSQALEGVLLVSTVAGHAAVPRELHGKPIGVVQLIGGFA